MGRLDGKVALITGIGGAQGRAAALLFAREGGRVFGCDVVSESAAETVRLVREIGGDIECTAPVDLAGRVAAWSWVDHAAARAGGIDILYNNAGALRFGRLPDISDEDWSFTIRNELDLILHTSQAAWHHLVDRGGGTIINVASISGLRGNSEGAASAHAAAKGGVIALSRQMAAEGAARGIRVNAISPGAIETPASQSWLGQERFASVAASIPLGRWGRPEDVAFCALYLASDEASWVTGTNIIVDGGATTLR